MVVKTKLKSKINYSGGNCTNAKRVFTDVLLRCFASERIIFIFVPWLISKRNQKELYVALEFAFVCKCLLSQCRLIYTQTVINPQNEHLFGICAFRTITNTV